MNLKEFNFTNAHIAQESILMSVCGLVCVKSCGPLGNYSKVYSIQQFIFAVKAANLLMLFFAKLFLDNNPPTFTTAMLI